MVGGLDTSCEKVRKTRAVEAALRCLRRPSAFVKSIICLRGVAGRGRARGTLSFHIKPQSSHSGLTDCIVN